MEQIKTTTQTNTRIHVYSTLKNLLMENALKPSASYLESELAQRLGVSRTPVREAMLQLERDGFVEVRPRHGMKILPISAKDMAEIYQILTELEPLAVELAAERGLSPEELEAMDQCNTQMETSLENGDLTAWATADDQFHSLLARYGGNKRLEQTLSRFRDQVHRARMATLLLRKKPTKSTEEHRQLVEYLRNRDGERARMLHRAHRKMAGANLVELLIKNGLDNL